MEQQAPSIMFLDLLPEIRIHIYTCLLVEENPISLTTTSRHLTNKPGRKRLTFDSKNYRLARDRYDEGRNKPHRSKKRGLRAPPSHTSIVSTNRQVYTEATPILYGNNHFSFGRAADLRDFLDAIGRQGRHLRYLEIRSGGLQRNKTRQALEKLLVASSLTKLSIHHTDVCSPLKRGDKINTVVKDCLSLVQSLRESYRAQALRLNALDVVVLNLSPCERHEAYPCDMASKTDHYSPRFGMWKGCRCLCINLKQRHADLQRRFRDGMASALEQWDLKEGYRRKVVEESRRKAVEEVRSSGHIDPRLLALENRRWPSPPREPMAPMIPSYLLPVDRGAMKPGSHSVRRSHPSER